MNEELYEQKIAPQYLCVDENGRILGITSADKGVEIVSEINFSTSSFTKDYIPKYKLVDGIVTERTEEEMEADRVEANKPTLLATLKSELAATDYKAIKYAEGYYTEEEYAPIKAEREALRQQIRELED